MPNVINRITPTATLTGFSIKPVIDGIRRFSIGGGVLAAAAAEHA
jgi:hypothetical protein